MDEQMIEKFAIRCALGNNGGTWAEHYTEDQKEYWRKFVRDLVSEFEDEYGVHTAGTRCGSDGY